MLLHHIIGGNSCNSILQLISVILALVLAIQCFSRQDDLRCRSDKSFKRVVLCDLSVKARKLGELETTGTRVLGAGKCLLSMIGIQYLPDAELHYLFCQTDSNLW